MSRLRHKAEVARVASREVPTNVLPDDLAGLLEDLRARGFAMTREQWHPWPRGGDLELTAPSSAATKGVRLIEDKGCWEVDVKLGWTWYEPHTALMALRGERHERRALNHEERRRWTLAFIDTFTGSSAERRAIRRRAKELSAAYTRWAEGKGSPP